MNSGEFIPRPQFDRYRELSVAIHRASGLKTHAGRMKALARVGTQR
jgi:hypothetical protein